MRRGLPALTGRFADSPTDSGVFQTQSEKNLRYTTAAQLNNCLEAGKYGYLEDFRQILNKKFSSAFEDP